MDIYAPWTDSEGPLSLKPSDSSTSPRRVKIEPYKYMVPWTLMYMYELYLHVQYICIYI